MLKSCSLIQFYRSIYLLIEIKIAEGGRADLFLVKSLPSGSSTYTAGRLTHFGEGEKCFHKSITCTFNHSLYLYKYYNEILLKYPGSYNFFKDWLQIFLNLGNCCSQKLFGHWQLSSLAEFPAWQCGSGEKCGKSASAHQITRWIKIGILFFLSFFCNLFQINHINYDHY